MSKRFPGMDPYLEDPAFWADFHLTFMGCWREAIADVLPEPVFDAAYARGRHARSLPYGKPPRAPMKKADKQWGMERFRRK